MNREEFDQKILDHLGTIHKIAMKYAQDPTDAEDLAQEAIERALKYADRYEERGSFGAWIGRVIYNAFVNHRRQDKRHHEILLDAADCDLVDRTIADPPGEILERLASRSRAAEIVEILEAELPPRFSEILILRAEGRTYREIQEIKGIPIGTVMSRLYRARRKAWEILCA